MASANLPPVLIVPLLVQTGCRHDNARGRSGSGAIDAPPRQHRFRHIRRRRAAGRARTRARADFLTHWAPPPGRVRRKRSWDMVRDTFAGRWRRVTRPAGEGHRVDGRSLAPLAFDLAMPRHRRPLPGLRVLPELVLRGLANETAAVIGEVPLEPALLHAAISTDSTSAQPVGGIASPRFRRSSSTSAIASLTISRAWSSVSPCVWTSGSSGTWA
jgi:hypothetical protein